MATISEADGRLTVTIGWPKFNGSIVDLDRNTGRASFQITHLFFRMKPVDVGLDEIADFALVGRGNAIHPRVLLTSGRQIAFASSSFSRPDHAISRIRQFLGLE